MIICAHVTKVMTSSLGYNRMKCKSKRRKRQFWRRHSMPEHIEKWAFLLPIGKKSQKTDNEMRAISLYQRMLFLIHRKCKSVTSERKDLHFNLEGAGWENGWHWSLAMIEQDWRLHIFYSWYDAFWNNSSRQSKAKQQAAKHAISTCEGGPYDTLTTIEFEVDFLLTDVTQSLSTWELFFQF